MKVLEFGVSLESIVIKPCVILPTLAGGKMSDIIIIQVYDRVITESIYYFYMLTNPPITSLRSYENNILTRIDRIDGDEEGYEAIIEVMEEVPGVPIRTEY